MQEAKLEARFQMWVARGGRVRLEPTERRVRARLGGITVADSRRAQLLYLPPPFNAYAFPRDDVRWELLHESGIASTMPAVGEVKQWTVAAGGQVRDGAVWTFPQPPPGLEPLVGLAVIRWQMMDAWFEEDDEVFVHPRDPYHRVDVLNSSRHVKVIIGGEVVAETRRPRLLFETGLPTRYYVPKLDVRLDLLSPTNTVTRCPYKGKASYWSVNVNGKEFTDIVWAYPAPIPECPKIENLLCFYDEKVDAVYVEDALQPRPKTPWS